jgi:hypothetical protein
VPHNSEDKRLRFHGLREAVNGEQDCYRPPDASSTTGVELVVAMASSLMGVDHE